MPKKRFHRTDRWNAKFAQAPDHIKPTIANMLHMLEAGTWVVTPDLGDDAPPPPEAEPIIRVTGGKLQQPGDLVAALGDVLMRFRDLANEYRHDDGA